MTHDVHWLPRVDLIIVMEDGHIKETGTYDDLIQNYGAFAKFLQTYLTQYSDDQEDEEGRANFIPVKSSF